MKVQKISQFEFIALMASLMAMVALSIDALLPALQQIGADIGMKNANDGQLLIIMIFLGLGIHPPCHPHGDIQPLMQQVPVCQSGQTVVKSHFPDKHFRFMAFRDV